MLGDDGYPYGIPISHYYSEEDGKIYFHGAKVGHKIDAIKAYDKASFCVYDKGYRKEGEWALNIKSVVIFGRIRLVEDEEKSRMICTRLCRKFTDDEEYLDVLRPLLKQKRRSTKAASDYELNQKLVRFALSRGFTYDIIRQCLDVSEEFEDDDF